MKSCWNLKFGKYFIVTFSLVSSLSLGQSGAPKNEIPGPNNEAENYMFPIGPGTPNSLAGTMGELRSNHFHSGIDVRTGNRIGLPVQAAQKGYVSRISISPYGFGNALYVTHPNGQTTVYAHLNHFNKQLAEYTRNEQYQKKSFDVNLYPKKEMFVVNRGDTIAFSGNSGSSQGPHLHFDIRDENNEALNPLEFKFEEIMDNVPPVVQKIALRTMDMQSRINDQFGRFEFYVVREGDDFKLPFPILAHGNIGVELLGYDRMDNSRARCGINTIELSVNDQRVFRQTIDKINFADTRNILTVMDYKVLQNKGERFNKLYVDDGNDLNYYAGTVKKGIIPVGDGETAVKVTLRDTYGNQSLVNFNLKSSPPIDIVSAIYPMAYALHAEIHENTVVLKAKKELGDEALIFVRNAATPAKPAYADQKYNVFLFDLRKMLPDSLRVGSETLELNFKDIVPSGTDYKYYSDPLDISFSRHTLYDTMFLQTKYTVENGNEVFSIGNPNYPIHRHFSVTLKPQHNYSEKHAVYKDNGRYNEYMGGSWANGRITFSAREFGDFVILQDTLAPGITKIAINGAAARFKIRDDLSGIAYYEASINGEWLLMNYDGKTHSLWAERKDETKPLQGDFSLKVVDNAGNENIFTQKIP